MGPRAWARRRTTRRAGRLEARAVGHRRGRACGRAPARSWCWSSRWRRACFWAGIAATFVMGLGTAITVAAIATLAVGATLAAQTSPTTRTGYGMLALRGIEVAAAFVVLAVRGRCCSSATWRASGCRFAASRCQRSHEARNEPVALLRRCGRHAARRNAAASAARPIRRIFPASSAASAGPPADRGTRSCSRSGDRPG